MNGDRLEGTAKNMGGKLEEGLGKATGDVKSQVEGTVKQAVGATQDLYGQARETAGDAVTMSLNLGYLLGTAIFAIFLVIAVGAQKPALDEGPEDLLRKKTPGPVQGGRQAQKEPADEGVQVSRLTGHIEKPRKVP